MDSTKTSFNRDLGSKQGRIVPDGFAAPGGEYVFCLGYADKGHTESIKPGDFALTEQEYLFTPGTKLIRLKAIIRPPSTVPVGYRWVVDFLVDDKVYISTDLVPGGRTRTRSFGLNVSKLDPNSRHFLTARLRFAQNGSPEPQFISLASFEAGPTSDFGAFGVGAVSSSEAFGTPDIISGHIVGTGIGTAYASGSGTISNINANITFSAVGTGGVGTTSAVATAPAVSAGDLLIYASASKPTLNSTSTTTTGTNILADQNGSGGTGSGTDAGTVFGWCSAYVAASGDSATTKTNNFSTGGGAAQCAKYTKDSAKSWSVSYMGTISRNTSSTSFTGSLTVAAGDIKSGDIIVAVICSSKQGLTFSSPTFSCTGITFTNATVRGGLTSTTNGNHAEVGFMDARANVGINTGLSLTVTATASAATSGCMLILRLREV